MYIIVFQGDSGGPIFAEGRDGRFHLLGVTSDGSRPCGQGPWGKPTVYASLNDPNVVAWIKFVTRSGDC